MTFFITTIFKKASKLTNKLRAKRALFRLLSNLGSEDDVIDIGANVGNISWEMSKYAKKVYAFEPFPPAYLEIVKKAKLRSNIIPFNIGISTKSETMRLYLHKSGNNESLDFSQGSSLISSKCNVDNSNFVDVECVTIQRMLEIIKVKKVKLVKMDIEGAEVELLLNLIETNDIDWFDVMIVEMHDHKIPVLKEKSDLLRKLVSSQNLSSKIMLDWI